MIIVAGALFADAADREPYLRECLTVITAPGASNGDFSLVADPIEHGRVNVYEQWESVEAVNAFRGSSSDQLAAIRDARVFQHEVGSTTRL